MVTKEDVYLYQRPLDYSGDHSDPVVVIQRPLHPVDQGTPWPLIPGSHDRHCYTTQIPELGLFVVASPNGRAGIFSLTKSSSSSNSNLSSQVRLRPSYSLQLEYVLPFANDDETKIWDVNDTRLIGVAAGPVQGMLDKTTGGDRGDHDLLVNNSKPGNRRWRLLMYFTDHTILAFELGKRREVGSPTISELIV